MNQNEFRLYGMEVVCKAIEKWIDENENEFLTLYEQFLEYTCIDRDNFHWHSNIDVYLKSKDLDSRKNTMMFENGKQEFEYLCDKIGLDKSTNILLNLYAVQFFMNMVQNTF